MRLYRKYFAMHLKSEMQFRASFFMTILGQFLVSFSVFLGIHFMYLRFSDVKGYSYQDSLLCFSVVLLSFSIAEMFVRGFDTFAGMLGNGEFDRILVRPRNEILQVLCARIAFTRVGRIAQAVVMFVYVVATSGIRWSAVKILAVVFMVVGGTALFSAMFVIYAALCFFTTQSLEFMNVFTDGAREYGKYPIEVYGKRVLWICTFLVPYALVQYYPFLYLTGRSSNAAFVLLPSAGLLFLLPAVGLWKLGVRHFKSTGS
ncbi:MAG: ABC-2 family transporter protein [Lachnospiraceae bacterium]|nr:ABC-2 family transporter protein [Lachnospiraceae bacterium]